MRVLTLSPSALRSGGDGDVQPGSPRYTYVASHLTNSRSPHKSPPSPTHRMLSAERRFPAPGLGTASCALSSDGLVHNNRKARVHTGRASYTSREQTQVRFVCRTAVFSLCDRPALAARWSSAQCLSSTRPVSPERQASSVFAFAWRACTCSKRASADRRVGNFCHAHTSAKNDPTATGDFSGSLLCALTSFSLLFLSPPTIVSLSISPIP